jgi:hypothetical protein
VSRPVNVTAFTSTVPYANVPADAIANTDSNRPAQPRTKRAACHGDAHARALSGSDICSDDFAVAGTVAGPDGLALHAPHDHAHPLAVSSVVTAAVRGVRLISAFLRNEVADCAAQP